MKIDKFSLPALGFIQATGLLIYIFLIALFLNNANRLFGKEDKFVTPIAFLLLFIVSALISSFIVLARVGFLFWEKRYRESFTLLGWTLGFSVLYLFLAFSLLIVI